MNESNQLLAAAPVPKAFFKLAIPAVAAQLINILYNLVDKMFIGHIPTVGKQALAGVGVTTPVILAISAFAALVSMGGAPKASILLGRGETERAEKVVGSCTWMLLLLSVLLTGVMLIFGRPILLLFGASADTISFAADYMNIYCLGNVFTQLTLGLNAFITAQGFATAGMLTVLIGALVNIVLDPLFIFALDMGVRGAALATVISQGISCAWVIAFLCSKRTILRIKPRNLKLGLKLLPPCIALGLAAFIMQASESVLAMCFNSSLLKYGGDIAVGAMTILTSVQQFAMMPLQGIAQGAQPITSYNYGARNSARVKKSFQLLLTVSLTYTVLLWLAVMLAPGAFAHLFTTNEALIEFTTHAMRIYCAALFFLGIQIACQMTFVSIGNAPCSIIVAVLRKFVLLIPLIFILPHFFADQTSAVYLAEPVADLLAMLFTVVMFATQFKKALKRLDAPQQPA